MGIIISNIRTTVSLIRVLCNMGGKQSEPRFVLYNMGGRQSEPRFVLYNMGGKQSEPRFVLYNMGDRQSEPRFAHDCSDCKRIDDIYKC